MTEMILTKESIVPFQQWLLGKGLSENTIKAYSTDVRMFFQECNISSCLAADLKDLVAIWITEKKTIVSPKTTRRRMASLREFSTWAGEGRILLGFKMPSKGQDIPHPLPGLDSDLRKMLDLCKTDKHRCLVALLGLEGLRISEALLLRPSDIDVSNMTITVWGKGDKQRIIPITKRAWEYIAPQLIVAMMNSQERLVPFSDRGARNFITELGRLAGIPTPVASHDLRATFATLAYRHSRDIRAVQGWLGHASINTTQIYVQSDMERMRAAGEF